MAGSLQTYIIYKSWIYIFPSFRAYGAWCDNVDVDSKLESEERTISAEYNSKLLNENCVVLDPVSLKDGWLKERDAKKGMVHFSDLPQITLILQISLV